MHRSGQRWIFDPARRWRGGRRELVLRDRHQPEDGDFCIAEVPDEGPAHLVEILGAEDRPEWDNLSVVSQYRLRTRFPVPVTQAAEAQHEPGARERKGRLDLRDRLVFTIDPEDAKDHDDALSIEALDHGRFEVGIHIADVSHYVAPGGALDDEARLRGTSTYLPGEVVPMLPHRLSSDVCSLKPDRDRLALSVFVEMDGSGERREVRFAETVIRSRHRLSYEQVQAMLDGAQDGAPDLIEALSQLRGLARAQRERRRTHGSLELEVSEVKVKVDEHGRPVQLVRRQTLESHGLIEEFMLLANRCVGEEGARRSAGLLYRVHEPPSPHKMVELEVVLKALGLPRPGLDLNPAGALQALLAAPLDPARRRLLHRMVLRSLARARYLERDLGHFGLGTREYCHFTSPIRRYPDLHNHARVREWIRGRRSAAWDPLALAALADGCSATEEAATAAERDAVRLKGLRMLQERLGESFAGTITGVVPQGVFVELDDPPAEGFVRLSLYLDDHFIMDSSGVRLVGRRTHRRFALGDPIRVTVARVDVPGRQCDLALELPQRRTRRARGRN